VLCEFRCATDFPRRKDVYRETPLSSNRRLSGVFMALLLGNLSVSIRSHAQTYRATALVSGSQGSAINSAGQITGWTGDTDMQQPGTGTVTAKASATITVNTMATAGGTTISGGNGGGGAIDALSLLSLVTLLGIRQRRARAVSGR